MTNATNSKSPKFFAKVGILIGFIVEALTIIFFSMTDTELQHWIGKKETIRKKLRDMFQIADAYVEEKEKWRKFYQKHFSRNLNFSDVFIPERPEGKWRLIIIAEGLTLNQVFERMKKLFDVWKYWDDLDVAITINVRDTKKSYAIWVRDEAEPDVEFLGKRANEADADMKLGVTLLERLIHEIDYFEEKGKHLDIKGVTFCSGSRSSDSRVPGVDWIPSNREVFVDWYSLDESNGTDGLRQAVYA